MAPSPEANIKSRGVLVPMDAAISPALADSLRQNSYDSAQVQTALKVVEAGDTVLELGGGIGFMSTALAKKREVKAIHSFEPNPALAPLAKAVHKLNKVKTVKTYEAVLAARKGKKQPFYVRDDVLLSSLSEKVNGTEVTSIEKVEVLGLNTVVKQIKPDVLICDIEGAEADLLPHLKYDGLKAAVIALHPQWIGPAGVRAVFEAMHAAGLAYSPLWSQQRVVCFRRDWPLA